MILTILSNKRQYQVLADHYYGLSGIKILCDNPGLYDFLKGEGVDFDVLDDELLKDSWKQINNWSCEKALLWDQLVDCRAFFNGIELNKALSVYFSYYLVSFLKNYLFAKSLLAKYKPEKVIVYDGTHCPEFPRFNGNYFLNLLLKDLGEKASAGIIQLFDGYAGPDFDKRSFKDGARAFFGKLYSILFNNTVKRRSFIVCGWLRDLADVIRDLKKRDKNVVLYSHDFRLDQFKFCLDEKIQYIAGPRPVKGGSEKFDLRAGFHKATEILRSRKWFTYNEDDLSGYICNEILKRSGKYLEDISVWMRTYAEIAESHDLEGVVLDQDEMTDKAFMAAFYKSKGIPVFALVHGRGRVDFALSESNRKFDLSRTFVHSEYEKSLFTSRGWDTKCIEISGTPRKDGLVGLSRKNRKTGLKNGKMEVLYCGSTMLYYTPEIANYVGILNYEFGTRMRGYLLQVIDAMENCPLKLTIKPHYSVDEEPLRDFIRQHGNGRDIIIVPASSDMFSLMAGSHAVLMGHWSTALLESIILGIPTFVLDNSGLEDAFPFAKQGLCTVLRKPDELRGALEELYSAFSENKASRLMPPPVKNKIFFTGLNDGKNTQRVVDHVIANSKNRTVCINE